MISERIEDTMRLKNKEGRITKETWKRNLDLFELSIKKSYEDYKLVSKEEQNLASLLLYRSQKKH